MGFRSTFVSSVYSSQWPNWIKDKYGDFVNFDSCLSSKKEIKVYNRPELIPDIHTALKEMDFYLRRAVHFTVLLLHECDGVTRYQFYENEIICSEPYPPSCWEKQDGITHYYCSECSTCK